MKPGNYVGFHCKNGKFWYTWGPLSQKSWAGTCHMGNRPYFRRPSIMLMSSSNARSKSPFPEMRQKRLLRSTISPFGRSFITKEEVWELENLAILQEKTFSFGTERNRFFLFSFWGEFFIWEHFVSKTDLNFDCQEALLNVPCFFYLNQYGFINFI